MSLVCTECERDMEPSDPLPGRGGTLVHPYMMARTLDKYIELPRNQSLCYTCIESELPGRLKPLYEAYRLETRFRTLEERLRQKWTSERGRLILQAFQALDLQSSQMSTSCLDCDKIVENGKPYFSAHVLDRIKSPPSPFLGTYSWSQMEKGLSHVRLCLPDFQRHFPKTCAQLCYHREDVQPCDQNIRIN